MERSEPGFLNLTAENLEREHICCAIAGQQHEEGVARKKEFLARGFRDGLVFRKLDVRGKVFVEYAPAEAAWRPIHAPGYLVIHCLWVSGRYKGQQLGRELLQHCVEAVGDRHGVVSVSGRRPYLTDPRFYRHHGFEVVDQTETGFDLVCFKQNAAAPSPRFSESAKRGTVREDKGVHFEYVYQCPFVPDCLRQMSEVAREFGLEVTTRELATLRSAQEAASPFGTFGAFLYGRLLTHELMSPNKFRKLLEGKLPAEGKPSAQRAES